MWVRTGRDAERGAADSPATQRVGRKGDEHTLETAVYKRVVETNLKFVSFVSFYLVWCFR